MAYNFKRGEDVRKSVNFTIKMSAFDNKGLAKNQKIKYKGVYCKVLRINQIELYEGEITVYGQLTPLEDGLK